MSERNPISARSGANNSGSDTITATSQVGTPSSTIITRLSVPLSKTTAIPTDTWNNDRRMRRPSGSSAVAASANGRKRAPSSIHPRARLFVICIIARSAPAPATHRIRWRSGRCARRATCPAAAPRPAGARSPPLPSVRSRAPDCACGNKRPTVCITASAGVRGANVKSKLRLRALGEARNRRNRVAGAVVDQRIHRNHMIKPAERRIEHVARQKLHAAGAEFAWRARTGKADQRRRQVDRDHARAAPRRLDRERAGTATCIEQPLAAQVGRQPRRAAFAASRRDRRGRSHECDRPGRRRSGATRHRPPCGRNRSRAARVAPGRTSSASVEPQEIENVAILERRGRQRFRARP